MCCNDTVTARQNFMNVVIVFPSDPLLQIDSCDVNVHIYTFHRESFVSGFHVAFDVEPFPFATIPMEQ